VTAMVEVGFPDGRRNSYPQGTTLLEISREAGEEHRFPIIAAMLDNQVVDLRTPVDRDCRIEFLDLSSEPGIKAYQRSLAFVMIAAAGELFPGGEVTVEHSLSKGLYCELHLGREVTGKDIRQLQTRMEEIIQADLPLVKRMMSAAEAAAMFEQAGREEKAGLLRQLGDKTVSIYYCGQVYDYMHGVMAPSTGCLNKFELKHFPPGFILRFPEKEIPDRLPAFVEQPKLARIFLEAEEWGKILGCSYVSNLNDSIARGEIYDLIRVSEALHEKKIAQIADYVADNRRQVRLILIAGPSSSGKTTFAQRLGIQLRVNGLRPITISLDDYFLDREFTPRDETGAYDFDALEAVDIALFNEHLVQLFNGEEIELPTFNFAAGRREYRGRRIRISSDQPLVLEGIHCLNERLTPDVLRSQKIKIYVSALTQLSIDNHNRIPTTDTRLIRRIVRDSQFRGHDALATLRSWPMVRRGEEKNIFPFQEEADVMFNSALIYELAVLKKYAEPLLNKIGPEVREYAEASRLLDFLAHFRSVDDDQIPNNSILREFIGNSCFYVAG